MIDVLQKFVQEFEFYARFERFVLILTLYRNKYYFPSRLNEETEIEDNSKENLLFFYRIKSKQNWIY